jgi:predicted enzyme involved in methoxymalonyl-ACP biosynthesis
MSCRVLKRGMEAYVLNTIADLAKKNGYKTLLGEYIPTPKNEIVKDHYKDLGFILDRNDLWCLNLDNYKRKSTFIVKK